MSNGEKITPEALHARLMRLERDFSAQIAWCRKCKLETETLLAKISKENAEMLTQFATHARKVATHASKVNKILAQLVAGLDDYGTNHGA